MSGFVKLDSGMLDSSLWVDRDARSIFITALLMARPVTVIEPVAQLQVRKLEPTGWQVPPGRYGIVEAAGIGIARRDGLAAEEAMRALEALCAPDPESRSDAFEGRRMARVDGGYLVLNFAHYREKDYTVAERQRRHRERVANAGKEALGPLRNAVTTVTVTQGRDDAVTHRDSYASASASGSALTEPEQTTKPVGRDGLADPAVPLDPAEFEVFGEFGGNVMGLVRASRRPEAVLAVIRGELAGDYGPPVSPKVVGLACKDYAATSPDRFSGQYFRGFVRRIERERAKHTGAAAARREDRQVASVQEQEQEVRQAEKALGALVAAFKVERPDEYAEIARAAEVRCTVKGMFRDAMVAAEIASAVRDHVHGGKR